MKIKLIDVIRELNGPTGVVMPTVDDYDTYQFDEPFGYTKAEVLAKQVEMQADYDSKQYQRDRKEEYPTIEECVHAILDGELDDLQIKRQVVKEKYPKGAN
jgi:hypothetical protein